MEEVAGGCVMEELAARDAAGLGCAMEFPADGGEDRRRMTLDTLVLDEGGASLLETASQTRISIKSPTCSMCEEEACGTGPW